MHEKHLIDDLLQAIIARAKKENGRTIAKISVWLGALSHMTPAHFREHFEMAALGTIAENASLAIDSSDDIYNPMANRIKVTSIEIT